MNGIVSGGTKKRRRLSLAEQAWQPQARRDSTNMVFTGLTVTIAGHFLKLQRDESLKVAMVVSECLPGYVPNGTETEAVHTAATKLCERARRVLGSGWIIHVGGDHGGTQR